MNDQNTPARIAARPSLTQLHSAVANWNGMHPVGTPVEVTKDDGTIMETKTTSEAWILGGHSPVVKLEGIAGCYSLNHVRFIITSRQVGKTAALEAYNKVHNAGSAVQGSPK